MYATSNMTFPCFKVKDMHTYKYKYCHVKYFEIITFCLYLGKCIHFSVAEVAN